MLSEIYELIKNSSKLLWISSNILNNSYLGKETFLENLGKRIHLVLSPFL